MILPVHCAAWTPRFMMDFCRISGAVAVSVSVGSRAQSHKPRLLFRTTRPPILCAVPTTDGRGT
jgi:hypothetical protein